MMFSTLYRDNYNRRQGSPPCAGERCGSHAGVDIAVPSGTTVRAALAGKIVESGCKQGAGTGNFGGTIVIEADNPYLPSNKVYLVYAHLDKWNYYAKGTIVTEGTVIGLSGGDPNAGICPGASGGAHLHFQVDKQPPDSQRRPWFPRLTGGAERPDSDHTVTKYTHNPLPFVLGYAYRFTFEELGNKELWNAMSVTSFTVAGGSAQIDSNTGLTYIGRMSDAGETTCATSLGKKCSRQITLDADIFKKMMLTLDFACVNNPVMLYYRTSDKVWHVAGLFGFSYVIPATYMLNFSTLASWKGIITDFKIKPSFGCTANPGPYEFYIKELYFQR